MCICVCVCVWVGVCVSSCGLGVGGVYGDQHLFRDHGRVCAEKVARGLVKGEEACVGVSV